MAAAVLGLAAVAVAVGAVTAAGTAEEPVVERLPH